MANRLSSGISNFLAGYLSRPQPGYRRHDTVPIEIIASVLQPGDVVLVEGNSRISVAIKYLTQSSWSHSCLYVGAPGQATSEPSLLEADLQDGVRMVGLDHYRDCNLRICRPVNLGAEDRDALLEYGKSRLGHKYDIKNIIDLVRYLVQKPAVPNRYRRSLIAFGSGEPTKVICSTLIAGAFQAIDYPILPVVGEDDGENGEVPSYYKQHFTHFTPRDFDLSPYFEVIKPTLESGFDYKQVNWLGKSVSAGEQTQSRK